MLQAYVSSVSDVFIWMLHAFHLDVAKVDRDVAHVAVVVHVCCKYLFQMFQLFSPGCVLFGGYICCIDYKRMLQVRVSNISHVLHVCCSSYSHMLQPYVCQCSPYFIRMFGERKCSSRSLGSP